MAQTETTRRRRRPTQSQGVRVIINVPHPIKKNPRAELPQKRVSAISNSSETLKIKDLNKNINIRVEECESRDLGIDEIGTSKANKIIRNYQEEIRL